MYEANFEFNTNTIEFDSEINTKDIQANLILNILPNKTSQLINDSDYTTNTALNNAVNIINNAIQAETNARIAADDELRQAIDSKDAVWGGIQGNITDQTDLVDYIDENGGKIDIIKRNNVELTIIDKTVNVEVPESAGDITYSNPDYPTVAAALDKLLYVAPTVSILGGGNYEIGYTKETTNLTWTWNKTIRTQSLNQGIGDLEPSVRNYTYNTPITSNTTFTITGSDGTQSKSASTSVNFLPKRYWGVSTNTSLTDEQILALSSELSTSRTQTRTFNCSGGKYFYFVIRTQYCSGISFKVGGLAFSDMLLTTRNVVNAQGFEAQYNIYRVNNIQTGSAIVVEVL